MDLRLTFMPGAALSVFYYKGSVRQDSVKLIKEGGNHEAEHQEHY
jgi:hypothetical protein